MATLPPRQARAIRHRLREDATHTLADVWAELRATEPRTDFLELGGSCLLECARRINAYDTSEAHLAAVGLKSAGHALGAWVQMLRYRALLVDYRATEDADRAVNTAQLEAITATLDAQNRVRYWAEPPTVEAEADDE